MDSDTFDWLESSKSAEHIYENKIDTPDDDWWESTFDTSHADATEQRATLVPTTAALRSVPPFFNSGSHSPSLHSSSHPYVGARSDYQNIQSPTDLLPKFDTQPTHYYGEPNNTFLYSNLPDALSYGPLQGIGIESAGYAISPDKATSSHRSLGISCGFEQQPRLPFHSNAARSYDEDCLNLQSPGNKTTSNALPASRAGHVTSDESAKPYFCYDEDHRYAQPQILIDTDEYKDAPLAHSTCTSLKWPNEAQNIARPSSDPGKSSPKDSSQASLSSTGLISANRTSATDDSWQCDNCSRVLATKGTKNRSRNKRRHRCPGTGPNYPCLICPKSFNRGDARLLHVRKRHPEFHSEPPRPRKRKSLQWNAAMMSIKVSMSQSLDGRMFLGYESQHHRLMV